MKLSQSSDLEEYTGISLKCTQSTETHTSSTCFCPGFLALTPSHDDPRVPRANLISRVWGQQSQAPSILCSCCIFWPYSHLPRFPSQASLPHIQQSHKRLHQHCGQGTFNEHVLHSREHLASNKSTEPLKVWEMHCQRWVWGRTESSEWIVLNLPSLDKFLPSHEENMKG